MTKKTTVSFYNFLTPFYFLIDFFFNRQKKCLTNEINKLPIGDLIDIGIGTGSQYLRPTKHNITGIDSSSKMLNRAKKRLSKCTDLHVMDAHTLSFKDGLFDYAVLSHIISTSHQPEKLIYEATRVLKKEGKLFVLNHFSPNNWLRLLDIAFNPFSKLFHFKSYFRRNDINFPNELEPIETITFGYFKYYQLLIFKKK